ncbi:zinc finger, C2H2 type [Ancylostoma ceylanicum]|uniref:Zinc finger, C2H2 type n=1 Tax=Ancylostoma ceylanicum TaxID=53326 RepID=A0A0D6L7D5_9BILA|nr:zinc finger, C2H2 type [Ancylostoma ceylanicum]
MRESHTVEEQLAVGLEIKPATPVSSGATSVVTSTPQCSSLADTASLSTTMASLVDVANMAAAAVGIKQEVGSAFVLHGAYIRTSDAHFQSQNSFATALSMDSLVSTTGFLSTIASTGLPSALDQIRAFAENSALLPDSGTTLANALGVMSQEVSDGIDRSPEKLNNSEPRRNSNGKMKQYKCKQCPHISFSKDDQWAHARTHIPVDKQMNCPTCNFVTEYKHHLEYHIRNHIGSKPFQCKKCSYTCVNKSMLNSHMKSHTNVYQFRCMDCTYATKYCHSLKLHLKKYDHRRVPDGMEIGDTSPTQVKPEPLAPYPNFGLRLDAPSPATTLAQTLGLAPGSIPHYLFSPDDNPRKLIQMEQMSSLINGLPTLPQPLKCAVCDFQTSSQEELMRHNVNHFLSQPTQSPIVSLYQALPQGKSPTGSEDSDEKEGEEDQALYNIHMGYHGYEHVFKCNRCGHIAPDSLNFNLHLLQASHE